MFKLMNITLGRALNKSEISGAFDGGRLPEQVAVAAGLETGTQVATNTGWRANEDIVQGDAVLTFDGDLQKVCRITRRILWSSPEKAPKHLWPLEVPAHALGNQHKMNLLPEQNVLVETDAAEEQYGDPFTVLPAAALIGFHGITQVKPREEVVVYTLHFEQEQIVFSCSGALFLCPANDEDPLLHTDESADEYKVLPMKQACHLVSSMKREKFALNSQVAKIGSAQYAAMA